MERAKNKSSHWINHSLGSLIFLGLFLCLPLQAFASPSALTYQGRILKSDGTPLNYNNVAFIFQIKGGANGQCLLYQEMSTGIDLSGSGGVFDVPIGLGTVTYPATGSFTVLDAFNNSTSYTCGTCTSNGSTVTCAPASSTYTPNSDDQRILKVQFFDGNGWKTISPDSVIRSVPFAGYSLSAQKLGSNVASDFVLKNDVNTNTSCDSGNFLTWNATTKTFGCAGVSGASGGTVNNITSGNSYLTVVNGSAASPQLTVNVGQVAGTVAAGDDARFTNARTPTGAAGGVLSGTYPNPTLVDNAVTTTKINDGAVTTAKLFASPGINRLVATDSTTGESLAPMSCSLGQTLAWTAATGWQCTTLGLTDIHSKVSPFGGVFANAACGVGQSLFYQASTDTFLCQNIGLDASQITAGTIPAGRLPASASYWSAATGGINYAGGYVGVGTTTPLAPLHVKSTTGNSILIENSSTSNSSPRIGFLDTSLGPASTSPIWYIDNNADTFRIFRQPDISSSGTVLPLTILNTGKMGVNNGTPRASLHVYGSGETLYYGAGNVPYPTTPSVGNGSLVGTSGTSNFRTALQDGSGRVNQYWNAYWDSTSSTHKFTVGNEPATRFLQTASGTTTGLFQFFGTAAGNAGDDINWTQLGEMGNANSVWFSPRGTNSDFFINAGGNVGMGTNTPTATLDIRSSNSATLNVMRTMDGLTNSLVAFIGARDAATTDSGIYVMQKDAIGISSNTSYLLNVVQNGISKMAVTGAGRVGIGTTTPTVTLDMSPATDAIRLPAGTTAQQPTAAIGLLRYNTSTNVLEFNNGTSWISISSSAGGGNLSSNSSGAVTVAAGGTNQNVTLQASGTGVVTSSSVMTLTGGQISTTPSNGALVVSGGMGVSGNINAGGNISASSATFSGAVRAAPGAPNLADSSTVGFAFGTDGDTGMFSPIVTAGSANGQIGFFSNNTEIMRIGLGKVGIGLTTPSAPLEVRNPSTTGQDTVVFSAPASDPFAGNGVTLNNITGPSNIKNQISFKSLGSPKWSLGNDYSGSGTQNFYIWDGVVAQVRVLIDSAGNTGIGTTTPRSTLDVQGNTTSTTADVYGAWLQNTFTPASSATGVAYGSVSRIATATGNAASLVGSTSQAYVNTGATGTVSSVTGSRGEILNYSAATISSAWGTKAQVQNLSNGSITIGYGSHILPPLNMGSGSIGTYYGLYISQPTAATTNYALYSEGGTNYFGGNVGIGTTAPTANLDVAATATNNASVIFNTGYGAGASGGWIMNRQARGTPAAPTAVQTDDQISVYGARGYGATGFASTSRASVRMFAAENWTDANQGAYLMFDTTPIGSTTTSERMRILANGNVGIGTTNPLASLHVETAANTGIRISSTSTGVNSYLDFFNSGAKKANVYWKDGSSTFQVNDIGTTTVINGTGGYVGVGTNSPNSALTVGGNITPEADNTRLIGTSTYRFNTIYSTNGVLSTSDARLKRNIASSDLGLQFINSLNPVSFRWKSEDDTGSVHYGLIAQDLEKKVQQFTGSKENNGIIDHDAKSDRYGVRYSELISPIIKAIKEFYASWRSDSADLHSKNAALENRMQQLESENAALKDYLCAKDPKAPICNKH